MAEAASAMTRQETLALLYQEQPFDLLVIGGGATGCGIALDAALRGLKVALVEQHDLAEGTSSRSTKLIHGGVRYLENAVRDLDRAQFRLVRQGLRERWTLLKNAPHLSRRLPFVVPLYSWFALPYVLAGLKFYDLLAGPLGIGHSRLVTRGEALRKFPMLKAQGLKGGVLYYDGQFNDARTALALAITAREQGAVVASHLAVTALHKNGSRIDGAVVRDMLTGIEGIVCAKGVINATGPRGDRLRVMDDPAASPLLSISSGVHIVLDKRFAPLDTALMIPATEDGRVLFIIPWQGHALIGATDDPAEISDHPLATEAEIGYLLRHVGQYFDIRVSRNDITAAWSGHRPLLADCQDTRTSNLVREHAVILSRSGLLSVLGGKWTSYRRMAEDAVDRAVREYALNPLGPCRTAHTPLAGGAAYQADDGRRLAARYGLPADVAATLSHAYGDRADAVAALACNGLAARLHPEHPFIEAQVIYAVRNESALRAMDVLARRTPLALTDSAAAAAAAPRVIALMAEELGWDHQRCRAEQELVTLRLSEAL